MNCFECKKSFRVEKKCCCVQQDLDYKDYESWVYQNYTGRNNNLKNISWGESFTPLIRLVPKSQNTRFTNPRSISNIVFKEDVEEKSDLNNLFWMHGQFIDHLFTLVKTTNERDDMTTPLDDEFPNRTIPFSKSVSDFHNSVSHYVDGTNLYGYSNERNAHLRSFTGGKLKMGHADNGEYILEKNVDGLENATHGALALTDTFLSGDIRVTEIAFLTAMHVLWSREHNLVCEELLLDHPEWLNDDSKIYETARQIVVGKMQHVTFNEFVPLLIGENLPRYTGYKSGVNSSISHLFAVCAYRLGHSMVPSKVGDLNIRDAFFNPTIVQQNGVDGIISDALNEPMNKIDHKMVEDLRTFLFGPPTNEMLLDLAALNIQRGRDHEIPDYNSCRQALGLPKKSFNQLRPELQSAYDNENEIDPWVGGLCESPLPNKRIGEFFHRILKEQFLRLRDGDRFYFENNPTISEKYKKLIRETTFSDILKRNTSILNVKDNAFLV